MRTAASTGVSTTMSRFRALLALASTALVVSCGAVAPGLPAAEHLDESTGATLTRVAKPLILASEDPARAANARDYVYAAPFAVSQAGKRSWWLWLGVWSTIDRGATLGGEQRQPDVSAVMLVVDGEPMELDMGERSDSIPGVKRLPYAAPVATARNILLPLSRTQVSRLSRAATISIRTDRADGGALFFEAWQGNGGWTDFARLAVAEPRAAP